MSITVFADDSVGCFAEYFADLLHSFAFHFSGQEPNTL
jgi:hypothetical protein